MLWSGSSLHGGQEVEWSGNRKGLEQDTVLKNMPLVTTSSSQA